MDEYRPTPRGYFGPCEQCGEPSLLKFQEVAYCLACLDEAILRAKLDGERLAREWFDALWRRR